MSPIELPLPKHFQEVNQAQDLFQKGRNHFPQWVRAELLTQVASKKGQLFPIYGYSIGSNDPKAPVLGFTGGVHGLERIGAQVALTLLDYILERLKWDEILHHVLKNIRICFVPIVNPVGTFEGTRSNGNGVDLMRNAPIEGDVPWWFIMGGHRISSKLPWYRGAYHSNMELEAQTLIDFVKKESFQSEMSIWVDCHSGFGVQDQLWFPYARSREPFPGLPLIYKLQDLFNQNYKNHVYRIEPQTKNYCTHGDLWDFLYFEYLKQHDGQSDMPRFLPLTLEMGSWAWVKKNPIQIFKLLGPFNPIQPHRQKRILRRHLPLFDFLLRATYSHKNWAPFGRLDIDHDFRRGVETWFTHRT